MALTHHPETGLVPGGEGTHQLRGSESLRPEQDLHAPHQVPPGWLVMLLGGRSVAVVAVLGEGGASSMCAVFLDCVNEPEK